MFRLSDKLFSSWRPDISGRHFRQYAVIAIFTGSKAYYGSYDFRIGKYHNG